MVIVALNSSIDDESCNKYHSTALLEFSAKLFNANITRTQPMSFTLCFQSIEIRARPDLAYEVPDQTGPDTQICRTGPAILD